MATVIKKQILNDSVNFSAWTRVGKDYGTLENRGGVETNCCRELAWLIYNYSLPVTRKRVIPRQLRLS